MADTRVQIEAEDWVRENWLSHQFGQMFFRKRLKLQPGGVFDFDAVSADQKIVASISTSGGKTTSGKLAVGKIMKLRSDILFLLMVEGVDRRIIVLTDPSMLKVCLKEKDSGRLPNTIDFLLAELPSDLESRLTQARLAASREVTPRAIAELPDDILLSNDSVGKNDVR